MMNKRKNYKLLLIVISIICFNWQNIYCQTNKIKIAVFQLGTHPVIDAVVNGFKDGISTIKGDSITVQYYNANFDGQTMSSLSKQIVAGGFNIIVTVTTPATGQMLGANRGKYPLIFTFVSNPKDVGYTGLGSIQNTTGLSDKVDYNETLKLIRALLPNAKNIGYLITRSESNAIAVLNGFENVASLYGFKIIKAEINSPTDIRMAANALLKRSDLFLFGGDNNIATGIAVLISVAKSKNIPTFACDELSIERGAVASISVDYYQMGIKTANYAKRILGGEKASEMPVQDIIADKLVINKDAAQYFQIAIPDSIIKKANRFISK